MVSVQYCGIKRFRHTHRVYGITAHTPLTRSPNILQTLIIITCIHHIYVRIRMLGSFNYQYIITATGRRTAKHPTVSAQLWLEYNIGWRPIFIQFTIYIRIHLCYYKYEKYVQQNEWTAPHLLFDRSVARLLAHSCIQTQIYSQYFILFFLLLTSLLFFALSLHFALCFCSLNIHIVAHNFTTISNMSINKICFPL